MIRVPLRCDRTAGVELVGADPAQAASVTVANVAASMLVVRRTATP
ncbi:MAG TPA: hypothetical protein VKD72_29440 [Gemmataceae bacterium]|nr:hypothetical protein [Gemmataceae bacterium]